MAARKVDRFRHLGCAALLLFFAFCGKVNAQGTPSDHPGSSASTQPPPAQASDDVTQLELGKSIERELAGGQKHTYLISATEGQYLKVEIREHGIDVGFTFQLPSGEINQNWQPYGAGQELKTIGQVAESPGIYRVNVTTMRKAAPGHYEIRLVELRPATDKDRALQDARKLFMQYTQLRDQGRLSEAGAVILRVLEIREKVLGPDDLLVASTLGFVSNHYEHIGDYASAEPLQLRALKITEKKLGPDHPAVADELFALGVHYRERGDFPKAEVMDQKALRILEQANQSETPAAAGVLESLGALHYAEGDYAGAESYSLKARTVWEKLLGPDSYHLAFPFSFAGRVAYSQGDYQKAEAMFQRALALAEKNLGVEHLNVTRYWNDLGMLHCTTGDYAKGEALYERSLSLHQQKAAMSDPYVQDTLFGLARCLAGEGKWSQAVRFQEQASEIAEHYVTVNLAVGSEREKQAFLDALALRASRNISLQTQLPRDDPAALNLAATTILRNKGRVQDAVGTNLTALQQRFAPEDQKLLEQWRDLTSQLARLVLNGPQRVAASEPARQIKALEDQREQLEAEMSRRSAGFYEGSKTVTLGAIQAVVPEKAALVEFAVYHPFDLKRPDNPAAYGEPRYVAYVIRRQGEVRWQELGDAHAIDRAIDRLRQALRDPQHKDVQQLARSLDDQVMRPVRAVAGDATHLLISPDGELNLIPFEALVDEQGHYLVERYSISYLTTGRDLLRMQVARETKSGPVVLADPLFGESDAAHIAGAGLPSLKRVSTTEKRRNIIAGDDLSGVYFARLTGSAQEARAIRALFPDAQLLLGAQATKNALQHVAAPRILHIATHGFFLEDPNAESSMNNGEANGSRRSVSAIKVAEPLLRSGLALTGANLDKGGNEDGILTALEASNLNLWGTKLVTLSACETGVGEVKDGEGVYGLRRSFFLAGTESLVMSLWSVSDRVTRDMMAAYYTGLKQGLGRGEALRQAELAMLKRKDRRHPFYWASFIQSGEWGNLEGQR